MVVERNTAVMTRELSIYLDVIRFTAAVTVFVSHLSGQRFTGGLLWQSEPYGDQAVDVFFVLSGFVIAYVCDQRETTLRSYAVSRLARIYSVALPALVATFVLDAIGTALRPELYSSAWGYIGQDKALQFATSLMFVNRLWWAGVTQGSDLSYWSLSYEVWYYIIFGCCVFSRGKWKALAPFAAIAISGPNIVSLLPLWLMGVGCYYVCKGKLDKISGTAFCIVPLLLWIAYEIWAWHGHRLRGTKLPWSLHRNEIIQDYIVGSLFALHIIGFNAVSSAIAPALLCFSRQIKWAAGTTFTIYLFHLPVAQFATVIVPWSPSSWLTRALMFPGMLAILFAIAAVTERRKEWWRRLFSAAFDPNLIPIALRSPSAKLD